jgi:OmpA-OmpF porin, OOP family
MHKGILRIFILLIAALLNMVAAQASDYRGAYLGGKIGINNSKATGTVNAPSASTFAYGIQGGYIQGGYNWDVSSAIFGVGAYADFNSYEIHTNGVAYASRGFGVDAKLGLPAGDWLLYGKVGYGYSTGTRDLSAVSQNSPNAAVGAEYKIARRWGAIAEYKIDTFSNKDGSISIQNRIISFGVNYYFGRPDVTQVVALDAPELGLEPEPEPESELDNEPPPDIGSSVVIAAPVDPASWKVLLENNPVRIPGTIFVPGTAELTIELVKDLDEVAGFAGKYPDAKLEVTGYEDNTGSTEFLQKLSLSQAEAAKNYLIMKGVAANRISIKGEGSANPIGDNNTSEGRAKNRRIEVLSDYKQPKKAMPASPAPVPAQVPSQVPVPETWKILLQEKPVLIAMKGTSIVSGSGDPNAKIGKELDVVVDYAGKYPGAMLELVGYTDSSGSEKKNLKLSLARAESIKKYLVKKGVAANRITTRGEGSANPVGDNDTEDGRAKNRRVEIRSVNKVWKSLLESKPVSIASTNFVPGTSKLKPEVGLELDSVVGFAGKYSDAKLEVVGYSDTTNPALSLELADSVRNYLVTKGVADSRVTIKGAGSAKPVGDNKTKKGRAKNRRIEIFSVNDKTHLKEPAPAATSAPAPVATPAPTATPAPAPAATHEPDQSSDLDPDQSSDLVPDMPPLKDQGKKRENQ